MACFRQQLSIHIGEGAQEALNDQHMTNETARHVEKGYPKEEEQTQPPRLGLALGGGAARGIAHVGVLQVLWENEIPIKAIAGTSAGAMAGAIVAAGHTPDDLAEIARTSNWWFLAKDVSLRAGLLRSAGIERWLRRHTQGKTFRDLEVPLAVVTSDLISGETVVFTSGDVAWAARVSATVPGIYAPVEYRGRLLVDGGLTQNVPVTTALAMDVDVILAVSLNGSFLDSGPPERPAEAIQQAISILQRAHVKEQISQAHLTITPNLEGLGLTDFRAVDEFIQLGREAMERALPDLQSILQKGTKE
ncbi:MAG: patatin-like phospholipase family protein [Firmicutes bacterium]|nr:patatin-like phospholipase family protein [Bacillota bacterium]